MRKTRFKSYFILGTALLVAYVAQDVLGLKWSWLVNIQKNETYRLSTGIGLLMYLLSQWHLSLSRLTYRTGRAKYIYDRHKTWGALAPLFFYVHSTTIGYAYLQLLSLVYLANTAVGLFNQEILRVKDRWFFFVWMVVHVALSLLAVMLVVFHIFVVFYYE